MYDYAFRDRATIVTSWMNTFARWQCRLAGVPMGKNPTVSPMLDLIWQQANDDPRWCNAAHDRIPSAPGFLHIRTRSQLLGAL